ncbi:peptidase family A22 [Schizosaccharomyces japonicus yFS275]|uniref:Peptidase family A22 n=1 Tax=Schizosaccharomyces japonicus (strain yFS275 / FY16936) TaxID=402676 RepID=B6K778_SCHJY|nr:peptidase family A22 [Schizosaccharomyces japonicus yFS275]EEB09382.1 peptidase family A22 [Schizosaccharomyces japonicus yFS275]
MESLILAGLAISTVYAGSKWSASKKVREEQQTIHSKTALLFPIMGGAVLVSLYIVMKYWIKEYIETILQVYSSFAAAGCLYAMLNRGGKLISFFAFVTSIGCSAAYLYTKNWLFSNILSFAMATTSIAYMNIDSYATGSLLLAALFFYDIYFVFGTKVMVTVAKGVNIPAKYLFPSLSQSDRFSILGLGDIVLPGLMVSLMLRFDLANLKRKESEGKVEGTSTPPSGQKLPYFKASMVGYTLGLLCANSAVRYFHAAQPALLYLSPACIIAPFLIASRRKEVKLLLSYEDNASTKQQDKQQDTEKNK